MAIYKVTHIDTYEETVTQLVEASSIFEALNKAERGIVIEDDFEDTPLMWTGDKDWKAEEYKQNLCKKVKK